MLSAFNDILRNNEAIGSSNSYLLYTPSYYWSLASDSFIKYVKNLWASCTDRSRHKDS